MSKIPVNCKICNVEFVKYESEIKRTNNHFCSNKCSIFFNTQLKKIYLEKRKTDYYSSPKKCINCENIIDFESNDCITLDLIYNDSFGRGWVKYHPPCENHYTNKMYTYLLI